MKNFKSVRWTSILLGVSSAVFFAVLYLADILSPLEAKLYDFFLGFRANRPHIESVVFLDVDDDAIAYNGIYPWPRSIPADSLLRLKEHGAQAAIFDIEYIDRGPQGVDSLYLDQGLPADFERSFSDIDTAVEELFSALKTGRLGRADYDYYAKSMSNMINKERQSLFAKAHGVARDNDSYLAQALQLFGSSWLTLNLRADPLHDEQAERRPFAEEHFSYKIQAAPNAHHGPFVDILPPLPLFAEVAAGTGFTNVEIDKDGIRRRIYLAQNIHDHWYLQLAFAPLINHLGNPEIILTKRKLTIKQAQLPDGRKKDIVIPLDSEGRMMLDWPREDYFSSYRHISFAEFSQLDEIEADVERYCSTLAQAEILFFSQFDSSLSRIPILLSGIAELFEATRQARTLAMDGCSDDYFDAYIDYRTQSRSLIKEMLAIDAGTKIQAMIPELRNKYPETIDGIEDEAELIAILMEYISISVESEKEKHTRIENEVRDKFCILGRSDTGTTDMGANPFWGEYINVGTHAVVLDTILSESFINYLGKLWHILFLLIFVPAVFFATAHFAPIPRAVSGFAAALFIIIVSLVLFTFGGIFLGPLSSIFAIISAVIVREIMAYAGSEKEKRFIHTAFSTYLSGDVVKEIIADPSRLQLGGSKRRMTAIFTDIKDFSTISEKLDPEDLVSLLNRYLSSMSDVILTEKGTIDKYEGDAIIAFFGAPLDLEDHALRACISAITMRRLETELNKIILENKLSPFPLITRFGINTGNMVVGNMGTQNKMNYTIMGNAVNLAARLEGVNKQYGTWILTSEDTVRETGNQLLTRQLDRVRVVGINEPVRLYELLETMEHAAPEQHKLVEVFHQALDYFEKRNWQQAAGGFTEALAINADDAPAKMYLERVQQFMHAPPLDNWDGVYNLTEK